MKIKNQIINISEAEDIFNSSVETSMFFGISRKEAEISALDELLEEYNYDLASALNMTREEIKVYFEKNCDSIDEWETEVKFKWPSLEVARQALEKYMGKKIWNKDDDDLLN